MRSHARKVGLYARTADNNPTLVPGRNDLQKKELFKNSQAEGRTQVSGAERMESSLVFHKSDVVTSVRFVNRSSTGTLEVLWSDALKVLLLASQEQENAALSTMGIPVGESHATNLSSAQSQHDTDSLSMIDPALSGLPGNMRKSRYDNIIEKLERKFTMGHDMVTSDVEGNGEYDDESAEEDGTTLDGAGTAKKKKRKEKVDYYDCEDDFIDDSEAMMEIETHVESKKRKTVHSGFFVSSGELEMASTTPGPEEKLRVKGSKSSTVKGGKQGGAGAEGSSSSTGKRPAKKQRIAPASGAAAAAVRLAASAGLHATPVGVARKDKDASNASRNSAGGGAEQSFQPPSAAGGSGSGAGGSGYGYSSAYEKHMHMTPTTTELRAPATMKRARVAKVEWVITPPIKAALDIFRASYEELYPLAPVPVPVPTPASAPPSTIEESSAATAAAATVNKTPKKGLFPRELDEV
jgi:hypothetical protein